MQFYSSFGPMIAKTRLPEYLLERVNAYADGLLGEGSNGELLLPDKLVSVDGERRFMVFNASITSDSI